MVAVKVMRTNTDAKQARIWPIYRSDGRNCGVPQVQEVDFIDVDSLETCIQTLVLGELRNFLTSKLLWR